MGGSTKTLGQRLSWCRVSTILFIAVTLVSLFLFLNTSLPLDLLSPEVAQASSLNQAAPTATLSPAGLAVALQQAVSAVPQVISVTGLRVVDTPNDHRIIYIQATVFSAADATPTVEAIGRAVVITVGNDRFQLVLILTAGATPPVTFIWSDAAPIWSRVAEQPSATLIPPPTSTPAPQVYSTSPTPYFVVKPAHFRECPRSDCRIYATIQTINTVVMVVGYTQGDRLYGSDIWYKVSYSNTLGFIHSSLVSQQPYVPPVPTAAPYVPPPVYVYPTLPPLPDYDYSYDSPDDSNNENHGGMKCNDGTWSYAAHRQGACSHHGGIAPGY